MMARKPRQGTTYLGKPCRNGHKGGIRYKANGACVECNLARLKIWNEKNPEKTLVAQKAGLARWQKLHPDLVRKYTKDWERRNPEKAREIRHKSCRKWRLANLHKDAARSRARRAAQLRRIPPWAKLDEIEKFYLQAQDLTKVTGIPHEVDHIIPLCGKTVSGLHVENNLQVIPAIENQKKRHKFLHSE